MVYLKFMQVCYTNAMMKLFGNKSQQRVVARPTLPSLEDSLYPLIWPFAGHLTQGNLQFNSSAEVLSAIIATEAAPSRQQYYQLLYANEVYQQWINFTVFGRYIQRSFAAFHSQSEDSFNTDMPDILRHELMRHSQYLPMQQGLFFGGKLPLQVRKDKLLTTTLNPWSALMSAQRFAKTASNAPLIVNSININGKEVLAFAVRHNKRTSERLRSEVMVLDFKDLRLVNEREIIPANPSLIDSKRSPVIVRDYELR